MRTTLKTSLAVAAVLLTAMAFWPGDRPRGVVSTTAAQRGEPGGDKTDPLQGDDDSDPVEGDGIDPFGLGPQAAEKQAEQAGETPAAEQTGKPASAEELRSLETRQKLKKRRSFEFVELPLQEAIHVIKAMTDVQAHVALAARKRTSQPVTLSLTAPAEMVLGLILRDAQLDYVIRHGIVMISTPEDFAGQLELRVYNCRDMLASAQGAGFGSSFFGSAGPVATPMEMGMGMEEGMMGEGAGMGMGRAMPSRGFGGEGMMMGGAKMGMEGGGAPGIGWQGTVRTPLAALITETIEPHSWRGPDATMAEMRGLLVVKHHAKAHEQIERLLSALREADGSAPGHRSQPAPATPSPQPRPPSPYGESGE